MASLARAIEDTVIHGGDVGVEANLEVYESEMWVKANRILDVVEKSHKLYGVSWGPIASLRGWSLGMVDRVDGVEGLIMNQAGGG